MSDNMASTDDSPESEELAAPPAPTPPKRGPGHRGQDVRDTMAEMAAKAHEISLEAGSRMAGTMREVIGAAAGLTAFAIESARDLVQYMVRRGQMSQDEADKLMRDVEAAHGALPKPAPKVEAAKEVPKKAPQAEAPVNHVAHPVVPKVTKTPTVEAAKPKAAEAPKAAAQDASKAALKAALKAASKAASKAAPEAKGAAAKAAPAKNGAVKPAPAAKAAPAKAAAPAAKAAAKKPLPKRK